MTDRIGTVLAGYEIERELGRGGMGVVYLAHHSHLGRKVALKLLSPDIADQPQLRRRFIRESQLLASLEHPNIVGIYDAGEDGDDLYLAMRLIRGTDLHTVLARRGALPPPASLEILTGVAAALDEAHKAGLIHRDVKPANVFAETTDGAITHVWLGDFGLTKRTTSASEVTKTGIVVGTVSYMAPEQFEGSRTIDGRADQYSLGCLFYECLTGQRPFEREHQAAVMYAHLNDPPPRPTAVATGLPRAIDGVVARAMAKKPDDRYPTCGAFADAATVALGGRKAKNRAPVKEHAEPKKPMSRYVALGAAIAALGLMAAAIALGLRGGPPAQNPADETPAGQTSPGGDDRPLAAVATGSVQDPRDVPDSTADIRAVFHSTDADGNVTYFVELYGDIKLDDNWVGSVEWDFDGDGEPDASTQFSMRYRESLSDPGTAILYDADVEEVARDPDATIVPARVAAPHRSQTSSASNTVKITVSRPGLGKVGMPSSTRTLRYMISTTQFEPNEVEDTAEPTDQSLAATGAR